MNEIEAEREVGPVFETQGHVKEGFTEDVDENRRVSASEIFFAPGARTTVHKHTVRQILYVAGRMGIVASENDRYEAGVGDRISIPTGEDHWYGAAPYSPFSHISIVVRDEDHGGTIGFDEPDGKRSK